MDWPCFGHDGLLHEIAEGSMRDRRRIQMLHNLANAGGYIALKWAAEDRERWRHRERIQKPAVWQKTTDDVSDNGSCRICSFLYGCRFFIDC